MDKQLEERIRERYGITEEPGIIDEEDHIEAEEVELWALLKS